MAPCLLLSLPQVIKRYYNRFWQFVSKPITLWAIVTITGAILLGFILTFPGLHQWDDQYQYAYSKWLMHIYHLDTQNSVPSIFPGNEYYGPLWELILGILVQCFIHVFQSPYWIRHALNFALFPITIVVLYFCIYRAMREKSTALLVIAVLISSIRLGGHSLMNTKDAPAALFFLLSAVALWLLLQTIHCNNLRYRSSVILSANAGFISMLPFLTRTPLLLHFLLSFCLLLLHLFFGRNVTFSRRLFHIAFFLLAAFSITFVLYPPFWLANINQQDIFSFFLSYPGHQDSIPIGNFVLHSQNLPWWYPFVWIVFVVHPVALIAVCFGILVGFMSLKPIGELFPFHTPWGTFHCSIRRWLFLFVIFSFAFVAILTPNLYDEERQILFLFAPLFLYGILGLHILRKRLKYIITLVLIVVSTFSYIGWGRYSYTYFTPIVPMRSRNFSGDYWGLCISHALYHTKNVIQSEASVVIDGPFHLASMQLANMQNSHAIWYTHDFSVMLTNEWPQQAIHPFFVITSNSYRSWLYDKVLNDIQESKAIRQWAHISPTQEPICILAKYLVHP